LSNHISSSMRATYSFVCFPKHWYSTLQSTWILQAAFALRTTKHTKNRASVPTVWICTPNCNNGYLRTNTETGAQLKSLCSEVRLQKLLRNGTKQCKWWVIDGRFASGVYRPANQASWAVAFSLKVKDKSWSKY
jgi:hypothetical protein